MEGRVGAAADGDVSGSNAGPGTRVPKVGFLLNDSYEVRKSTYSMIAFLLVPGPTPY